MVDIIRNVLPCRGVFLRCRERHIAGRAVLPGAEQPHCLLLHGGAEDHQQPRQPALHLRVPLPGAWESDAGQALKRRTKIASGRLGRRRFGAGHLGART